MSADGTLAGVEPASTALREISEARAARQGMSGADFARFWMENPVAIPPSCKLLGCRPVEADPKRGFCRNGFAVDPRFCNPMGSLQGGFVAAMLDDTMAIGALFKIGGGFVVPTLEMKISYQKPVRGSEVGVEGWLVHAGRTIAFLEGQLFDETGDLCARASATAMVREFR
ncbi:MAG: PaaI family thioesterase [Alphaproteobacteria bacterium]